MLRNQYDTKRYEGFRSKWDDAGWNRVVLEKVIWQAVVSTLLNRVLSEMRKNSCVAEVFEEGLVCIELFA